MKHSLSGLEAIIGSVIFIASFVVFIKYFEFFDEIKKRIVGLLKLKRRS
jgi:hypothetical protein